MDTGGALDDPPAVPPCRCPNPPLRHRPLLWLSLVCSRMGRGCWRRSVAALQYPGVLPHVRGFLYWVRPVRQRVSLARGNTHVADGRPPTTVAATHARHSMGSNLQLCQRHRPELDVLLHYPRCVFKPNYSVLGCGRMALQKCRLAKVSPSS